MSVCDRDIVFNESWYGFSTAGAPEASLLARYLALVLGSRVALWISLITSGEFGFEREVIEKSILEEVAIPPFESLSEKLVHEVGELFGRLEQDGNDAWPEVDAWVAKLYGLGERDLTVIDDTLRFNLPYASNREMAQSEPSVDQVETYCRTLEIELARFAKRFECAVRVIRVPDQGASPWRALRVLACRSVESDSPDGGSLADIRALTAVADRTSATEIVVDEGEHSLAIMLLAQSRYWSETQARLAAQRLIWTRPELFRERPRT